MHYGARQYQRAGDLSASPRSVEIAVFRETNRRMIEAEDDIARTGALNRNHRMWSALVKDVALSGNPLPEALKQDLTSIGLFSMTYSTAAIHQKLPLEPLVTINEQIVDGLMMQANKPALGATHLAPSVAALSA